MNRMFRTALPSLIALAGLAAVLLPAGPLPAAAEEGDAAAADQAGAGYSPATLTGDFAAAYVIDADSGLPLVAYHETDRRQPASMLKMMTELIVLQRIEKGDLSFDETVEVSAKASRMGGSQVYLKHGETFTVRELLMALAIHSANDAAVALAEHVAGSVEAFVDLMNLEAKELGMDQTEFHTVHGLPPGWRQEPDLTTAKDLAILGRALVRHPEAREWASTETAPFRDGEFTLYNPNKLVGKYRGLDGIKTGYTGPAGFCVTASAVQMGRRLISVVMGCSTDQARATETTRLLSYGFNMYVPVELVPAPGAPVAFRQPIKGGKQKNAELAFAEALTVSVPRGREDQVSLEFELPDKLQAPLAAGAEVGRATAVLDGRQLGSVAVVTVQEIQKGNWMDRLFKR